MPHRSVLVTDFDGTLTREDYYKLVRERLVPPGTPDYWADYRAGRLPHIEALRAYFDAATPDEATGPCPELADGVAALRAAGVDLEVHANPGALEGGRAGDLLARGYTLSLAGERN
jgi:2-hydroxy-3-keto-5-methylthiopentenyl-1-phosphate phosphatase